MVRVLLVEDEPAVRRVLGEMLRREGFHVTEADGLEAAKTIQQPPELIVSDYLLGPGATSQDVARLWPDIPLVVVSGHHPPQGYRGVWVLKPVLRLDLVNAAQRAMGERP